MDNHVKSMDISNHQSGMDVGRVVRENGFQFVPILTNDGTFVNRYFERQYDAVSAAGAIPVPYVYLRPNWAQTLRIHMDMTPEGGPSIVDVEDGSGGMNEVRNAHDLLWSNNRTTPLLYWPRYHWQSVGSPDLTPLAWGVRGHWKSWYADSNRRTYMDALGRVPGYVWDDNRGGIPVRMIQFSGTGIVNGYAGPVDLNYFPGTRDALEELVFGVSAGGPGGDSGDQPAPIEEEEPDMSNILVIQLIANPLPEDHPEYWPVGSSVFIDLLNDRTTEVSASDASAMVRVWKNANELGCNGVVFADFLRKYGAGNPDRQPAPGPVETPQAPAAPSA